VPEIDSLAYDERHPVVEADADDEQSGFLGRLVEVLSPLAEMIKSGPRVLEEAGLDRGVRTGRRSRLRAIGASNETTRLAQDRDESCRRIGACDRINIGIYRPVTLIEREIVTSEASWRSGKGQKTERVYAWRCEEEDAGEGVPPRASATSGSRSRQSCRNGCPDLASGGTHCQ
jgi:hypothetical protein